MSVPRHLTLDPEVAAARVAAASGELAALVATPPPGSVRRPGVLLVPGYTGSKEDFLHLLPLLARAGYAATAVDMRGQYESGGPEDPAAYSIDALAADVASLLSGGEPMHVVGHSFGGQVCRQALIAGAPARSLTLLSSGPGPLGGSRGALIDAMRPMLDDGGVPAVWAAANASNPDGIDPSVAPEVGEFLRRRFLASPTAALLGMGSALLGAEDRTDALRAVGVPLFVLYGENDDAWSPAEQAEMAERLGARHQSIADSAHSPAVDATDVTAAALLDFWAPLDNG